MSASVSHRRIVDGGTHAAGQRLALGLTRRGKKRRAARAADQEEPMPEITRLGPNAVQVAVTAPCPRCTHREVCSIRPTIEHLDDVAVGLPELSAALTPTLAVAIECAFFAPEKKAGRPPTPATPRPPLDQEQRQAAAARMAHARAVQAERRRRETPAA